MIIWRDYMHFLFHVLLAHRLSFQSCKVQIILRFKSRLDIQYIVHGFFSIGYYLHYSFTFHFIERKIHFPLYQCLWMFSGHTDMRKWEWGEQLYMLFQYMPQYQALGSNKKNVQTHMHTDCILIILYEFLVWRSLVSKELTSQFKHTQSSESSYSHSSNVRVFDVEQQNIAKCFTFARRFLWNAPAALRINM